MMPRMMMTVKKPEGIHEPEASAKVRSLLVLAWLSTTYQSRKWPRSTYTTPAVKRT
jgi:hypothetical protein